MEDNKEIGDVEVGQAIAALERHVAGLEGSVQALENQIEGLANTTIEATEQTVNGPRPVSKRLNQTAKLGPQASNLQTEVKKLKADMVTVKSFLTDLKAKLAKGLAAGAANQMVTVGPRSQITETRGVTTSAASISIAPAGNTTVNVIEFTATGANVTLTNTKIGQNEIAVNQNGNIEVPINTRVRIAIGDSVINNSSNLIFTAIAGSPANLTVKAWKSRDPIRAVEILN